MGKKYLKIYVCGAISEIEKRKKSSTANAESLGIPSRLLLSYRRFVYFRERAEWIGNQRARFNLFAWLP